MAFVGTFVALAYKSWGLILFCLLIGLVNAMYARLSDHINDEKYV